MYLQNPTHSESNSMGVQAVPRNLYSNKLFNKFHYGSPLITFQEVITKDVTNLGLSSVNGGEICLPLRSQGKLRSNS